MNICVCRAFPYRPAAGRVFARGGAQPLTADSGHGPHQGSHCSGGCLPGGAEVNDGQAAGETTRVLSDYFELHVALNSPSHTLALYQMTTEMSTLRNKRIELLQGMQGKDTFPILAGKVAIGTTISGFESLRLRRLNPFSSRQCGGRASGQSERGKARHG